MIKSTIMFSSHTANIVHVLLRDTLIFLIVLFLSLFAWIIYGIDIDKLSFGKYQINGLYIKLNKKLTLHVNKVVIPQTKNSSSIIKIDEAFSKLKYLFTYFDYIELNEINFKNNKLEILFIDNLLYIATNEYEVAGEINKKGDLLIADISLFYIKKENIRVSGKVKYYIKKNRIELTGEFNAYSINGNFAAFKENEIISFALNSKEFSDLKTITDRLPIKDILKSWIAYKIVGKKYRLESFSGNGKIKDGELEINLESLRGLAIANDVTLKFKDELQPVLSDELQIKYRDSSLFFTLKNPTYNGRDLNGSRVSIISFKKDDIPKLKLNLHVMSNIDDNLKELLNAYHINIPISQKGELVNADVNISIPLKKTTKYKINALVDAKVVNSKLLFDNGFKLGVQEGNVTYVDGKVYLKNIKLKDKLYRGIADGDIDINKNKIKLLVKVDKLNIGNNFTLKKKNLKVNIDYKKYIINIPSLDVSIIKRDQNFIVKLLNLKTLKPYLKNIDIQIDGGKLFFATKKFDSFKFSGILKRDSCFFYDSDEVCHTKIPCSGTVSENDFILKAFDDRLYINLNQSIIKVNGLNIDLKEFLKTRESNNKSSKKLKVLNIYGEKSTIRYEEHKLVSDNYDIKITAAGNIFANATLDTDKVKFVKKGSNIKIEAIKIKDKLLHPLINFDGLQSGKYSFKNYGNPNRVMNGEIIIEGGVMRNFKAYNNTLALINTLPALATFQNPGYSDKGFEIKKGVAKYRKIGNKIIFDTIHIEGKSASIVGKGEIDLDENTINMNLAIHTARELSKVVSSLPIFGYILLGDDKSITVGLKITGPLSKPKVETTATKDILKLPIELIKRTLSSPNNLLNTNKKPKNHVIDPEMFNIVSP